MADERDARTPTRIQGKDEEIFYGLDCEDVGSAAGAITNPATTAWLLIDGEETSDESVTVLTGAPSVTDQIITLPKLHSLTEGEQYRVKTLFTKDGHRLLGRFEVHCPDD
jgi:hypothetical protein